MSTPSPDLVLIALGSETVLSLERIAKAIALAANVSYSKQALQKCLGAKLEKFLTSVAITLFQHTLTPLATPTAGSVIFPGFFCKTATVNPCRSIWLKTSPAVAIKGVKRPAI